MEAAFYVVMIGIILIGLIFLAIFKIQDYRHEREGTERNPREN